MTKPTTWERIGSAVKGAFGVSLGALFVIIASNGKGVIDAAMAFPSLVAAYATGLPFGFWSGVAGTLIATCFHLFARSWHKRSFAIELATIMVGLAVVMVQQRGGTPGEILSALLVGLVAGFSGLFISKGIRSITTRGDTQYVDSDDDEPEAVPPAD